MSEYPVERKKRPRRKHCELECHYKCNYKGCTKAYGTLSHLNVHVVTQNHGEKRKGEEFKEVRLMLRKRRLENKRKLRALRRKQQQDKQQHEDENGIQSHSMYRHSIDNRSPFDGDQYDEEFESDDSSLAFTSLSLPDQTHNHTTVDTYYDESPLGFKPQEFNLSTFDWTNDAARLVEPTNNTTPTTHTNNNNDSNYYYQSAVQMQMFNYPQQNTQTNFGFPSLDYSANLIKQDFRNFDYVLPNVYLTRYTS